MTHSDSRKAHLTGAARFVDDEIPRAGMLDLWPVTSPHASATITRRDISKALEVDGVVAVLLPENVPGLNTIGAVRDDEPLIAESTVCFHGQVVAAVVGESLEACRRGAELVEIDYRTTPAVLTIEEAIAASSYHTEPQVIESGSVAAALARSPSVLEGTVTCGGQEHFYLETQVARAEPLEDGGVRLDVSTQHPAQLQAVVSDVLGTSKNRVVVQSHRMGGAYGGKETGANQWAGLAAVAARKTGKPVRVRLNRAQDMALTGKRHSFQAEFQAGYHGSGRLEVVTVSVYANGGWSLDLSDAVMERALLHFDNAYDIPNARFTGRVCKTNLVSNTAYRGSGAAEAMFVIEEVLSRVARRLGISGEEVRRVNAYGQGGNATATPYGQEVDGAAAGRLWAALLESSELEARREAIGRWNDAHPWVKRGLAITPVKLGAGFPISALNQAGALVNVFTDGSVQVTHSGTESGQGIHTKIALVAGESLGIGMDRVTVMDTRTTAVPNTSATAVSSGFDLNAGAVRDACAAIQERMRPVAAQLLHERGAPVSDPAEVLFRDGVAWLLSAPDVGVEFVEIVFHCWRNRVGLSAAGFYRTPGLSFDRAKGLGNPFANYVMGVAVSEVEVDGFTGEHRLLRTDVLQDAGGSMTPEMDRCQVESGFVQGTGWLTCEELLWHGDGELWTDSAARYRIPTMAEVPIDFRVRLWDGGREGQSAREKDHCESRDVEEVGVALALSVREAIIDAVAAFGPGDDGEGFEINLNAPATPQCVFRAIQAIRGGDVSEASPEEKASGDPEADAGKKATDVDVTTPA